MGLFSLVVCLEVAASWLLASEKVSNQQKKQICMFLLVILVTAFQSVLTVFKSFTIPI